MIESDIKEYYTNGEFKGVMLEKGYIVDNRNDLNWCFNVSEKSITAIKKKNNRIFV